MNCIADVGALNEAFVLIFICGAALGLLSYWLGTLSGGLLYTSWRMFKAWQLRRARNGER